MGRGSRHSKNAGTMGSEALTYHERQGLGYGTVKERLGKKPVITEHGYLYSKEALLTYYMDQKKEKKKQLELWEAEQARFQRELCPRVEVDVMQVSEKAELRKQAEVVAFERQNTAVASDRTAAAIVQEFNDQAEHLHDRHKTMSSGFSIKANETRAREVKAQDTPNAEMHAEKPNMDVLCPACGKKLNMKRLVDVKFKDAPEGSDALHVDPVSNDVIVNANKLVVLKPTGDVVLEETYRRCIKPDGVYNGKKIKDSDVIKLQAGGTGFAAHDGEKLSSNRHTLLGPGSGKADLRGQHKGAASRFGLCFNN